MTHSIPFSLLRDGTWQLFNSHIAMLQCFRAEKKNPASSLSCREYLGKGNVIIHIGSGPGLGALGKEAFRTSTFQPTWKMGPPFSSQGHQPASCWLRKKAPGAASFIYSHQTLYRVIESLLSKDWPWLSQEDMTVSQGAALHTPVWV